MIDEPSLSPRSPKRLVAPVLVTVDDPRTAKVPAVPKLFACALVRRGNARLQATAHMREIIISPVEGISRPQRPDRDRQTIQEE